MTGPVDDRNGLSWRVSRLQLAPGAIIVVFKTPSDGRHFQPPLQRTNCNVLHAFFCLQNAGLVLKHQIPCLQAVTVLSGAY